MNARGMIISTALLLVVIPPTVAVKHCKLFSPSMPLEGKYCPGEGIDTPNLLPHQCKYICLQSISCKAYNYNTTERTCTRFTSPCSLAIADTMMEFMVFTERATDQCYQWIPYSSGDTIDPRMIPTDDPGRLICRMKKDGSDIVCYFHTTQFRCYGSGGGPEMNNDQGYPCQRMRIVDDCTVFWVPYTAGDLINPRAVTAGHTANGDVVYVTKFDHNYPPMKSLAGHYVEGADQTIGTFGGTWTSTTMMMMVVL